LYKTKLVQQEESLPEQVKKESEILKSWLVCLSAVIFITAFDVCEIKKAN
jgi:hypothetical protein